MISRLWCLLDVFAHLQVLGCCALSGCALGCCALSVLRKVVETCRACQIC
jgi:hypothetical protein